MDGLYRAAASPLPVEIDAEMHLMHPLRLRDFGSLEVWHLSRRRDPVDIVRGVKGVDDSRMAVLLKVAKQKSDTLPTTISPEDIDELFSTVDGLSMAMWLMFRQEVRHPVLYRTVAADHLYWLRIVKLVSAMDDAAYSSTEWGDVSSGNENSIKSDRFNWKHTFRKVCEGYMGMIVDEVADLTLFQLRATISPDDQVAGVSKINRGAAEQSDRLKQAHDEFLKKHGIPRIKR